ncbi:hypothetical protein TNCV_75911 [Trichonephila clavipes]|nr:hypothetical protein TNCV_75911 [Trichonephila clavipes]
MSQNKFELPQGAHLNNLEDSGPVDNGNNPNGSNNSASQNAPQTQLPPPIMLFVEKKLQSPNGSNNKSIPQNKIPPNGSEWWKQPRLFSPPERRSTSISLHLHSTNHQPSHSYQRPGSDFSLGHSSILCGDYNAHHTEWGCISNNQRGLLLKNFTGDTDTDILAPPTPTRFGYNSASTIDFALTRHFQRQLETDHLGDLIKRFHQKTGQSSTQSTPFKPIKGRKNNRKSPSPPPESASKKLKITEVETTNRFSNLQIEDSPIIEDKQEERDEDVPQAI